MESNVPCKFFAQGKCRFGDNCRFSHGGGGGGGSGFGFNNNYFNAPQNVTIPQPAKENNIPLLLDSMRKDMQEWDNGKIWPLSSYGVIGGKPSFAGLEEFSSEEIRFYAPPDLEQRVLNQKNMRNVLAQDSPTTRQLLEKVIYTNTPESTNKPFGGGNSLFAGGLGNTGFQSSPGTTSSIFGGSPSSNPPVQSIFGGGNTTITPFGSTTGNVGVGSGASSIFGGGGGSTLFGNVSSTTPSTFGPSSNNAFGSGSIFGGAATIPQQQQGQQQQPSTNLFSSVASLAGSPSFGTTNLSSSGGMDSMETSNLQQMLQNQQNTFSNNLFGQTQQPTVAQPGFGFGQQQPQQQQQPLQQPQPSFFNQQQQNQNLNQKPTTDSIQFSFALPGNQQQNLAQQEMGQQKQTSFFGGGGGGGGGLGSQSFAKQGEGEIDADRYIYSDINKLTQEELEAFKADTFTLENIPLKPPPRSLCI